MKAEQKDKANSNLRGDNMAMSEAAKRARAAYKRAWDQKNRDRRRQYEERYWEKKAAAMAETSKQETEE